VSGTSEAEAGSTAAAPEALSGATPAPAPLDRSSALAEGAPGIPLKFVYWALGAVLVLSLGGLIGEHVFSAAGLNPVPTTTPQSPTTTFPVTTPTVPTPAGSIQTSLGSFMGLSVVTPRPAPAFALTDQNDQPTSVPAQPPKVVVLTFFDAPCNDICPVIAAEIEQADADLGAEAAAVEFVTVNTDPSALAQSAEGPLLRTTRLGVVPNWHMVTGSLATLNSLWKAYGVSISVQKKTGLEAHNDVMDFVDARGDLRDRARPFADESTTGSFSLPPASIARWGQGIATYAQRLVTP
jgi:cytochrome oxidase Cu insertion factor (SCO1/SenC/PrrC family)